jgi:hypothetical protein
MKKQEFCSCPECRRAIRDWIHAVYRRERRWCGPFLIRALGDLACVPWQLYTHIWGAMAERGELMRFRPDTPNEPVTYLPTGLLPGPVELARRVEERRDE